MEEYIRVVSNEKPLTKYPQKFAKYIIERFNISNDAKLLDIGCGRGDFTQEFKNCGIEQVEGADLSNFANDSYPDLKIHICDLDNPPYHFQDNSYDIVFSKSVIEHFYYPEKLLSEVYRILKPGGSILFLTPDWRSNRKWFYDSFSHRTPFTKKSLKVALEISHFENINVEKFIQLPIVWEYPKIKILCSIIAFFTIFTKRVMKPKFIRFSKELMLVGYGKKPLEEMNKNE